jgi:hypothetical protein
MLHITHGSTVTGVVVYQNALHEHQCNAVSSAAVAGVIQRNANEQS